MLAEYRRWHKPTNSWHRWQHIWVNRDDRMARYDEDIGVWGGLPFRILGLWESSVSELRWEADEARTGPRSEYWLKKVAELSEESTIIKDAVRLAEMNEQVAANRSVFGPAVTTQRNEFPIDIREQLEYKRGKSY